MEAALGSNRLDPTKNDDEGSHWWLTEEESVPYSAELDAQIPVGTVMPGVLISGDYEGDRADIHGAAKWKDGHWHLETVRAASLDSLPAFAGVVPGVFHRLLPVRALGACQPSSLVEDLAGKLFVGPAPGQYRIAPGVANIFRAGLPELPGINKLGINSALVQDGPFQVRQELSEVEESDVREVKVSLDQSDLALV